MDLVLALPASSADAERGFSLMKSTKSDWRSRLSSSSLSSLMTVQLETPGIDDFNPEPSVMAWHLGAKRMPSFSGSVKAKHTNAAAHAVVDDVDYNDNVVAGEGAGEEPEVVGQAVGHAEVVIGGDDDEGFDDVSDYCSDYSDTDEQQEDLQLMEKRAFALFKESLLSMG
ncbi:uncharacterized protein LOC124270694 [Haliotis rubra]|uniref:uncharacterized protein LOC124270694 n=1 Tax=Haliotis rubra TaxID=36100 RepID=UPI001EE5F820|nr:uncharacterized protein LOC124270694 [Haliotis rubra]